MTFGKLRSGFFEIDSVAIRHSSLTTSFLVKLFSSCLVIFGSELTRNSVSFIDLIWLASFSDWDFWENSIFWDYWAATFFIPKWLSNMVRIDFWQWCIGNSAAICLNLVWGCCLYFLQLNTLMAYQSKGNLQSYLLNTLYHS